MQKTELARERKDVVEPGWETVRRVVDDMKRHVCGIQEMDELVDAWEKLLNDALSRSEGRPGTEDVEATKWVREHGGIDRVRAQWGHLARRAGHADRVDRALARRQRQIDESHAALRRRNDRIRSLASELNRAHSENHAEFMRRAGDYAAFADEVCERLASELRHVEGCPKDVMDAALEALDRRRMHEGYEWPRYESGEPVRIGGEFMGKDGKTYTAKQIQFIGKCFSLFDFCDGKPQFGGFYGERVKRPAPAVLAADGDPLEVGQTVWSVNDGREYKVVTVESPVQFDTTSIKVDDGKAACGVWIRPDNLTHQRPVLDADGVPIKKGDTVYLLPGEWCDKFPCHGFHGGEEFEVFADGEANHVPGGIQCREREKSLGSRSTCYPQPSQLTHTKPEPPKRFCRDCAHWQKDPTADKMGVCWFFYHEYEGQDCYSARLSDIGACEEFMPSVSALAEREGRVMGDKQMRAAVIRWLNRLVHSCPTCDVEMVADVLGLRNSGELRAMAQSVIGELEERGEA